MKIAITGVNGMLGSSVRKAWAKRRPDDEILGLSRDDADLRDRAATLDLLNRVQPDAVIHSAAHVGGIGANIAHPTAFLSDNLLIDTSVIGGSIEAGVKNFIYVGSSCMYPRDYRQPLVESDLLRAPLEPTNEGYAIAKIAGSKLCEYASREFGLSYKTVVPSNLYGPNDDYTPGRSHLVAAALSKIHSAKLAEDKTVEVWGDGTARREFTYVGDLAAWLVEGFDRISEWPSMMNIGCGYDKSVQEFHEIAKSIVGYDGEFVFDLSKPTGMKQKLMDSSLARSFGWNPRTGIEEGMALAYGVFLTRSSPPYSD